MIALPIIIILSLTVPMMVIKYEQKQAYKKHHVKNETYSDFCRRYFNRYI